MVPVMSYCIVHYRHKIPRSTSGLGIDFGKLWALHTVQRSHLEVTEDRSLSSQQRYRSTFEQGKQVTSGLEVMCHPFFFPIYSTCSMFPDILNVIEVLNE